MAETLTTLRDRVEVLLGDTTNAKWDADTLDECIDQALQAYAERMPNRAITTLTLSEAGREIDISSLSYRHIERVWWDYDSTDPRHPPRWRDFEVWAGDILYINEDDEPAASDVVRIWYTTDHTLNGLNSATVTTFPDDHAAVIILGAAAFAARTRDITVGEAINDNTWAPRNIREWGATQLQIFYAKLDILAATAAVLQSGTASAPDLDRWDGNNHW
jgi:hypothetical protein